jgi:hypothetical protein
MVQIAVKGLMEKDFVTHDMSNNTPSMTNSSPNGYCNNERMGQLKPSQ